MLQIEKRRGGGGIGGHCPSATIVILHSNVEVFLVPFPVDGGGERKRGEDGLVCAERVGEREKREGERKREGGKMD